MTDERNPTFSEVMNTIVGVCLIALAAWFGFVKDEYARGAFYGVFGLGCHISALSSRYRASSGGEK